MRNLTRLVKRRSNEDRYIYTDDLILIKPYADYNISVVSFIARFGPNDFIHYNKNIGFALIQYNIFALYTY